MSEKYYICGDRKDREPALMIAYSGNDSGSFAEGKIKQPNTRITLPSTAVEGALFQCSLTPYKPGPGKSKLIQWVIDPRWSWSSTRTQPAKGQIVGWATFNIAGSVNPDNYLYEVYPVQGGDGGKLADGKSWYYIRTDYYDRSERDSKL